MGEKQMIFVSEGISLEGWAFVLLKQRKLGSFYGSLAGLMTCLANLCILASRALGTFIWNQMDIVSNHPSFTCVTNVPKARSISSEKDELKTEAIPCHLWRCLWDVIGMKRAGDGTERMPKWTQRDPITARFYPPPPSTPWAGGGSERTWKWTRRDPISARYCPSHQLLNLLPQIASILILPLSFPFWILEESPISSYSIFPLKSMRWPNLIDSKGRTNRGSMGDNDGT